MKLSVNYSILLGDAVFLNLKFWISGFFFFIRRKSSFFQRMHQSNCFQFSHGTDPWADSTDLMPVFNEAVLVTVCVDPSARLCSFAGTFSLFGISQQQIC